MSARPEETPTAANCPSCGSARPSPDAPCPECAATHTQAESEAEQLPGALKEIAGYRIIRELGAGGMGTVYEAHEEKMSRRVALKVLSRHLAPSQKAADRFAHEAWIGGKLNHPNLVKIYERGSWEELDYFSMELIDGGSLADVIRRLKNGGRDERLGLEFGSRDYVHWAISQIIQAARGLDYAHRQGVVHRDIKPMNLLLSLELGTIKIADFGLAIDSAMTRMTTAGKAPGTALYMAPEQILGRQDEIDSRADIYALGVTLFELLTLELPYAGPTRQLYMDAVLKTEARRPSKLNERVSRDLEIVIGKTLEKNPNHRYPTVAAFAEDLENVLNFRPIVARPSGFHQRIAKWARRRPIHAALVAVLAFGVPAVTLLAYRASQQKQVLEQVKVEELESEIKALWHRYQYRDISRLTSDILQIDPDHDWALQTRAFARMYLALEAEDPVMAKDLESQSLGDIDHFIQLAPTSALSYRLQEWVLTKFGRLQEAREAEVMARRYRVEPPTDGELYFEAYRAYLDGEYEEALELSSELIVRRPNRHDAIALRGDAYEMLGDLEHAIQDYRLVAALEPDSYLSYLFLGRLYTEAGSLQEGLGYLEQALVKAPEHWRVYEDVSSNLFRQGVKAAAKGNVQEARKMFQDGAAKARKSLSLEAGMPWAHVNLGVNLLHLSHLEEEPDRALLTEAVDHFTQARSLSGAGAGGMTAGAYGMALVNECDVLIQLRDFQKAVELCEKAVEVDPENSIGFYNLAGVYALTGRTEEAFKALEKDFELGDHDYVYLSSDKWFEGLREDPRFADLIERMKVAASQH